MAELTNKMKKAAEMLVAMPEKSYVDIAEELGVSDVTLWRWRQREDFRDYEHQLCRHRFEDLERLAVLKLKENVAKNDVRSILYALDYFGFKAEDKVDITSNDVVINITKSDADDNS